MRPALAPETLLGAALAGRAPRSEGTPRRDNDAVFAGLLDGARQQQGVRAGTYDGSAFDVPEAKPASNAPRALSAAETERRQIDQRQQRARNEARRDSEVPEPTGEPAPRAAESKPAPPTQKPRAPDAPREAGRATKEAVAEEPAQPEQGATTGTDEATAVVALPAESEPLVAVAPTTQEWMARWASPSGVAGQGGTSDGSAAMPAALLPGSPGAAGAASQREALAAQAATPTTGLPEAAAQAAGAITAAFEETRADASAVTPAAAARIENISPLPSAQALATTHSGASPTAAPPTASVPVPLDAPDFSQALGWQLATLARDGVHEAQLQLNPVEMGPVQVQILLDRGQAQIDFTAAQQRTREVLEAGWPALAAAMHSAGFTLGGGGVFEQRSSAQDAQGQGGRGRARAGRDDDAALVEPGTTRLAGTGPRGLLDLYA
jgi:flagellar hook-length control protein FliK